MDALRCAEVVRRVGAYWQGGEQVHYVVWNNPWGIEHGQINLGYFLLIGFGNRRAYRPNNRENKKDGHCKN